MRKRILKRHPAFVSIMFFIMIGGIFCFIGAKKSYAIPATDIIPGGLSAAMGAAIDQSNNHLYFVEYNTGVLKRVTLYSPYTVDTIATGFNNPNDVELDLPHGFAYVTQQQDGILYKIDVSSIIGNPVVGPPIVVGIPDIVTFNIGEPQQLVLDLANNQAYTVGKSDNILYRIDLSTGVKTLIFSALDQPVGLAISADMKFAYVAEQGISDKISKIDLSLASWVEDVVPSGLTNPAFLAWTDATQNSLYVVQQAPPPGNKVSRIDLASTPATPYDVVTHAEGLASQPSGIVVSAASTPLYVTTDQKIQKADLMGLTGNIFMGVGHVPSTDIDSDGLATTAPGYFYQVKNAPFGGTLNIFLNLENFRSWGASHYEVLIDDGGGPVPISNISWKTNKWDDIDKKYKPFTMAPDPDDGSHSKYEIPIDGGIYDSGLWYPPFFALRWPSGNNGLYTFTITLYQKSGTTFTSIPIPAPMMPLNEMALRIDNTPPTVDIHNIFQNKPPMTDIAPCVIVDSGDNKFSFKITANDAEGHLYSYGLYALYGDNKYLSITSDSYKNHINPPPPPYVPVLWNGVINTILPSPEKSVPCNCAYTFYLWAWGRTINGYNRIQYVNYHKSITINLIPLLSTCTSP